MNKILCSVSVLFLFTFNSAQVGINTISPKSTLHIIGQASDINTLDGIIPPSVTGDQLKAKTYTSSQDGAVLYVTLAAASANRTGQTSNVDSPGYYYFSGTDNVWYRFQNATKNWIFDNAYDGAAAGPVDRIVTSNTTINNVDIGLSTTITVPANSSVKVVVNYSTPIGIPVMGTTPGGYMGIRFLKNGTEADLGSRKVTLSALNGGAGGFIMSTIGASYIENITNNGPAYTITYSLNGYIEKNAGSGSTTFRFNMWDAANNFNWGRGSINTQVYRKAL
ncbi:hypothetical protein ACM46_15955 [Chryseobacterium angstadtii]|uniref:Uncharacterized protein n=1 Tax=Chryseobacterium angstadtii TaxID=558151 RepID=A0A0J7I575_9FLAO|nr:hypothetical protein [Chryseobacterium angstadtii]KMQ61507.1 hypothetical protein ACM46_15955 [Chryseobacterium angstadtii]